MLYFKLYVIRTVLGGTVFHYVGNLYSPPWAFELNKNLDNLSLIEIGQKSRVFKFNFWSLSWALWMELCFKRHILLSFTLSSYKIKN